VAGTKEFSAHVPEEEYNFFMEQVGKYGAAKWFINTALKTFNQKLRENPSMARLVGEAIDEMVYLTRESKKQP
jgi:hypothetical protein